MVIGGTSGIGLAISLGLAEAGADVVASARRQQQVDETAAEIEALGRRTLRLTCDMQDRGSLERLLAETVVAFGQRRHSGELRGQDQTRADAHVS